MNVNLRLICAAVFLAVCGNPLPGAPPLPATNSTKVYSICDVLKNLKDFDKKMVAVRGFLLSGPHGSFLTGDCPSHLTVKGYTWPDTIWLTWPHGAYGPHYEVDAAAHERVRKAIGDFHLRELDRVILTYVGVFEAKDTVASVTVTRDGKVLGIGFGPDVDAPAQLWVHTVENPSVLRHARK